MTLGARDNNTEYARPEYLVETDWLEERLGSPGLRIFDCAACPSPNPDPELRKKYPLKPQSGYALYEDAHIPGAGFIDVPGDLADKSTDLPMMMPPAKQVAAVFGEAGIGRGARVVLYSSTNPMWATRVWWILKAMGFDNAAILNGGLSKWVAESKPLSSAPCTYEFEHFAAMSRPEFFTDKQSVRARLGAADTLLIHALTPSVYDGSNDTLVFGRRGRIPGSINIPSGDLHVSEGGVYRSAHELRQLFASRNADIADHIIVYCGGGINATNNAFALSLLGYDNVTVYDGSMSEWGNDHSLPIELG